MSRDGWSQRAVRADALPALGSVRVAARARRSRRSDCYRLDMLAKGPWFARACLARARAPNGVRGFSRFDVVWFRFALTIDRGTRGASVRAARLAPGWPSPQGHGLDPTPTSYKTGAKNI